MTAIKGPKLPTLIQAILFYQNPFRFLKNCREKYGDIFRVKLPGFTPTIIVSDAQSVKKIFTGNANTLCAGEANSVYFAEIFGKHSLLTLDGAAHLRERKLILPALHGNVLRNYREKIIEITKNVINKWPEDKIFPVFPELQSITLQVILSVVFGIEKGASFDTLHTAFIALLQLGTNPTSSFLTGLFPGLLKYQSPKIKKLFKQIHSLLQEQIQIRREHPSNENDALSMLINAKDENGNGLNDEELRSELITLLIAGHDTTATTAAWVMHSILSHPEVYKKIKHELSEVLNTEATFSSEQIQQLHYLQNTIKETQRRQPIIPLVARVSHETLLIKNHEIPKGYTLMPSIYLAGNDPNFWHAPEQFSPERFLQNDIDFYHYFPFGGGVRRCIGAAFAMFEMQIVLAQIFYYFDIALKPNYRARPVRHGVTFGPSGGVPIKVITK